MMTRRLGALLLTFAILGSEAELAAQPPNMPPAVPTTAPSEPDAIPLDPVRGKVSSEIWAKMMDNYVVRNVTQPTITPVLPDPAKANGKAIIVAPGGAFMMLSLGWEGWNVARTLADHGYTAFVLKYRLLPTPKTESEAGSYILGKMNAGLLGEGKMPTLQNPDATQDGLAALRFVRAHAEKYHIDPKKVGMMGFSAGAMLSLNTVLSAAPGEGPDYLVYVYGPQAAVDVPTNAPPMFAAIAFDDPLFPTGGFPLTQAWHRAGKPVELHAYQSGGHGFGMGFPGSTTSLIMSELLAWLDMQDRPAPAPAP
jgi:acetyl esterase/lipase